MNKKPTIFVYYYYYDKLFKYSQGGPHKVYDLASNFVSLGYTTYLIAPNIGYPDKQTTAATCKLPIVPIPLVGTFLFGLFSFFCSLFILLKNGFSCNLVYVRTMSSLTPLCVSVLSRSKLIVELNDNPYRPLRIKQQKKSLKWYVNNFINRLNYKVCDKIFTVNETIKQEIARHEHLPLDKIIAIQSGANIELFKPMDKYACARQLGLDPNTTYIGFAGNYAPHVEGIDTLVNAAPLVLQVFSNAKFLIIGDGGWDAYEVPKLKKFNIVDSFIFCGDMPYHNVPPYMNVMDIGLAPLLYVAGETSAVKIFDYLACAKPVITSKIRDTADYLEEGNCVSLVEPENPQALAQAIIDLLKNPRKMKEMGRNGRAFITQKYDRKFVAERAAALIDKNPKH